MRGYQSPAVKAQISESQKAFSKLSRGRRTKLATAAQTTLVKVDQWARGQAVAQEVAEAIERAYAAHTAKKK